MTVRRTPDGPPVNRSGPGACTEGHASGRTFGDVRIAALDLGSNSFHLLVADATPDGTFDPVFREKEMLRLGDVVARTGRLSDDAIERALETVRRFRALAESAGTHQYAACATSAIREADNGADLVARFATEAGWPVRVISGREEASLIFKAVQASVLIDPGPALCLDLGGGSLEVVVGDARAERWATSVKLGVARLTAELVGNDPPRQGDLRKLRKRMESVLAPVAVDVAEFKPRMMVGTSGSLCDLARMAVVHQTGAVPISVNQHHVSRAELEAVHEELIAVPAATRRKLAGLDARRAELAPTGSLLALVALELFGFEELVVGEWALREGMVLDAIGRHPSVGDDDPRLIRAASVIDLCQRCGWREDHGRQVATLATKLFDLTADLHRLDAHHRELLEHGALLHDIGEHVSSEGHHKHTAYLIQHGRLRGFSPQEVMILATLGRYHRQGEPKATFEPYAAIEEEERPAVRWLTALLQVADGLDRAHAGAVEDIEVDIDDKRVVLRVRASTDADLELWGARRKRALFEQVAGRRLELPAVDPGEDWQERRGA
jgi:exopolyphosphatase/guanosine-5'-triphosphate,3'-diphosphate pyrophosphatase